ncbi:vitamin B12 transporter [Luteibacter sp. Sphag1AF]|uniref:TonB-dependent receptor domain-containing protein n=1 Tax=Luteibacter sp. Sphag1AF TaxID=2587031 RepID=UPI0016151183|nr:TonB-dependent receptor [Luteibacter sp. Sphag1AF]MBB3226710.1 vitamin B12 transporter [Luteibacter sp. Sphag1AF]
MKKTLLATALLSCIAVAHAADRNDADKLDPVVVTATRTAMPVDETLAPVTVITRQDIERLQPQSVTDLLKGLPGVAVVTSGGIGQQTSLFMRGSNSSHTLLLIDGVRVGTVGAGIPAYEQIPVEQIERIEIVRGPRSSLYGSDAIGGVIQIFTRHGQTGEAPTPSLTMSAGSHGLVSGQFGLSGGTAHSWYNASLGGQYTSGINACRVGAAEAYAGCFADEPDHDSYRTYNGSLSGGYRFDNGTEISANWLRSKGDIEYDGTFQNYTRRTQQVAGAKLAFNAMDIWRMTFNVGQNIDRADNYLNGPQFDYLTNLPFNANMERAGYLYSKRNQASWQNDFTLAPGQILSAGVDYQREHLDSDTAYARDSRNNTGVFALYQGVFGPHEIQLSARHDHNTQFGNHSTGAASYGFRFDNDVKITASYGTSFHAPTFNDVYYPYGVPVQLKPEKARNAEVGVSGTPGIWTWAVNAYQTNYSDLIGFDANYLPINVSKARVRGVEGQFGADMDGWHLRTYLTWQQPRNRTTGVQDGNRLARRPDQIGRIDLDRDLGQFSVGGTLNGAGKSFDDAANTRHLGGYATTDLRATWRFQPAWSLQAKVANVFDRSYETASFYNQLGRTFYLTVRYMPGQ